MKHGEILAECVSPLEALWTYCDGFPGTSDLGAASNEPPPAAFSLAFDFGIRSMKVMDQALSRPEFAVMALTLCRPFYELAISVLWATRQRDGWRRLQIGWARKEEKAANDVIACPAMNGSAEAARGMLSRLEPVLAWTVAGGKRLRTPPDLFEMLRSVTASDDQANLVKWPPQYAKLDYVALYGIMCRPAHGNLLFIANETPDFSMQLAVTVAVLSTHRLLQAFCHVAVREGDQRAAIRAFEPKCVDLLARCQELTFAGCR